MNDDEKELEELAKKMYAERWKDNRSFDNECRGSRMGWIDAARIARDHFAKPVMGEEKRREMVSMFCQWSVEIKLYGVGLSPKDGERLLTEWGAIPPRPAPSMGERFAATFPKESGRSLPEIAKRFDEVVGPLVEFAHKCERNVPGGVIGRMATDALAHLEMSLGGGKP